jgi:hypothetical protein
MDDLVGVLEHVSGIELPHACEARVVATATVYAAEATTVGLRASRSVAVTDDSALVALVGADEVTAALRAQLQEALEAAPARRDDAPDAVRAALAARGHVVGADEPVTVTWRQVEVDVVALSHGPAGAPLLVLVTRQPVRWLGVVERLARGAVSESLLARAWRWLRTGSRLRVLALVATLGVAVLGMAWLLGSFETRSAYPGVGLDSYDSRAARGQATIVVIIVAGLLSLVWNERKVKTTACACRKCEARRERGAARARE